jgi:hypothetical protein
LTLPCPVVDQHPRHVGQEQLKVRPFAGAGPRVEMHDVAVEVEAGDLGAVPAVELIGGPGRVHELAVEDAIVHDDLADLVQAGLGCCLDPEVHERRHVDALLAVQLDELEQVRVPEPRIAGAGNDQAVPVGQQPRPEVEVGGRNVRRRARGQQLHVAGGDQHGVGVEGHQRGARLGVADADGDRGAGELGPLNQDLDLVLDACP